jgi:anhydro-N-acetylmuramic acid kinase
MSTHDGGVRVIHGCMSGTSCDGIDVAAVAIEGAGWSMRARFLAGASIGYDEAMPGLAGRVRSMLRQRPVSAGELATLAHDLASAHVRVLQDLALRAAPPTAIAMHGQTLFHAPPISLQLCNPWPVAQAFGVPVLHDLRGADLAAGGQGAPLTPTSDAIMYACGRPTAVVNLGGFANATVLPPREACPDGVRGFDVCLCNQLLDELARTRLEQPCDWGGAAAGTGTVDRACLAQVTAILGGQSRSGRSLGTSDEQVGAAAVLLRALTPHDACATAVAAIADTIIDSLRPHGAHHLMLAGGGVLNAPLHDRLAAAFPGGPAPGSEAWPPAYREAAAMAILGALSQDGIPPGLPAVTGRGATMGCCNATLPTPGSRTLNASDT